jgi:hypothetical protein
MLWSSLSALLGNGHRHLALTVVISYILLALVSVARHDERYQCKKLKQRALSLLRESARHSVRADGDTVQQLEDAASARTFVSSVERLLSPAEVRYSTGLSIDAMRDHTDSALDNARLAAREACSNRNSNNNSNNSYNSNSKSRPVHRSSNSNSNSSSWGGFNSAAQACTPQASFTLP